MRRRTLLLAALALLPLAGCGRKGKPIPPDGSVYPRHYPHIEFPGQEETRPRRPVPEADMEPDAKTGTGTELETEIR